MYKKVFFLLLILTILISVPVYAEDENVYTLESGKIYTFRFNYDYSDDVDLDFSDNVIYGINRFDDYADLTEYRYYGSSRIEGVGSTNNFMFVYNWSDSEVYMTLNDGEIASVTEHSSPFTLVMFDGGEEGFEFINVSDGVIEYKRHYYNEDDGSIDYSTGYKSIHSGNSVTYEGKGILMFDFPTGDVLYNMDFNGVYEVGDYISEDFFLMPPWILVMDLAGLLGAFWNQLLTLLPVGLVILSVFLLISLLIYTMRLFL